MLKPAYIEQPTPAKRGSRARHFTSDLAALGLHCGQHGFDGGRDRNAEGFASSAFGAGERKDAILEIHAGKRDLRLAQSAPRSQGDFKGNPHPFGHSFHGQSFPGNLNLIIRKHGLNSTNRPPLNSVIQKGNRVHLSEQSALPMNPFKNLQILAGLVPSSLTAGRAGKVLAPSQINFTIGWRKRLQGKIFFGNKSFQMTPRVKVVGFCERGNRMIFNQIINPAVAALGSIFGNAKSSSLSDCLCAVKSVVDTITGGLTSPYSSFVLKSNKEPRTTFFNVRVSHGIKGNICVN